MQKTCGRRVLVRQCLSVLLSHVLKQETKVLPHLRFKTCWSIRSSTNFVARLSSPLMASSLSLPYYISISAKGDGHVLADENCNPHFIPLCFTVAVKKEIHFLPRIPISTTTSRHFLSPPYRKIYDIVASLTLRHGVRCMTESLVLFFFSFLATSSGLPENEQWPHWQFRG